MDPLNLNPTGVSGDEASLNDLSPFDLVKELIESFSDEGMKERIKTDVPQPQTYHYTYYGLSSDDGTVVLGHSESFARTVAHDHDLERSSVSGSLSIKESPTAVVLWSNSFAPSYIPCFPNDAYRVEFKDSSKTVTFWEIFVPSPSADEKFLKDASGIVTWNSFSEPKSWKETAGEKETRYRELNKARRTLLDYEDGKCRVVLVKVEGNTVRPELKEVNAKYEQMIEELSHNGEIPLTPVMVTLAQLWVIDFYSHPKAEIL